MICRLSLVAALALAVPLSLAAQSDETCVAYMEADAAYGTIVRNGEAAAIAAETIYQVIREIEDKKAAKEGSVSSRRATDHELDFVHYVAKQSA